MTYSSDSSVILFHPMTSELFPSNSTRVSRFLMAHQHN